MATRTARQTGWGAYTEDREGIKTWIDIATYQAWVRGERVIRGAVGGAGGCPLFDTATTHWQEDTLHTLTDGRRFLVADEDNAIELEREPRP